MSEVTIRPLDVTDDAAVDSFAKDYGRVDALINCAGILLRDKEYEIATFVRVLDVNLTGTFRTCMAFRPALAQSKGSIVNIASMNAIQALPRLPAYCASKGGVVMLTKALALSWASEGIRVNAVVQVTSKPASTRPDDRIKPIIVASRSAPHSNAGANHATLPALWHFSVCRRRVTLPARPSRSTADS
jgi:NAD(P)-dependent dehydrogenase (short-subunit alcohol dehydrogenase family)